LLQRCLELYNFDERRLRLSGVAADERDADERCCMLFEVPPAPCQLVKQTTSLSFNTSTGDFCRSTSNVMLTTCIGYCEGYDGLQVRPVQLPGQVTMVAIHQSACTCCTGLGYWIQQPVVCDKIGTTYVELYEHTSCACDACIP